MTSSPIAVDPDDILQIGIASLQAAYPTWTPVAASYDYRLMRAVALMVAEAMTSAGDVPDEIIQYVGTVVYRTAPFAATSSSVTSTWTVNTTAGFTISAGTRVGLTAADGTLYSFSVQADVTIPPASSATTAGQVVLIADEPGTPSNGLSGSAVILDRIADVVSAVTVGSSSGGVDAETNDAYTVRVEALAQLIAPRPILPADFAAVARLLVPGVQRALAVDGLNGDTLATGQERCVTVFPVDAAGANVSGPVKTAILAQLAGMREDTFEVFVNNPTRTAVAVNFTGVSQPGYDAATVEANAIASVQAALSPAAWGTSPNGDLSVWVDDTVVRFQDIVTILNNVDGFDHYTALTLNGSSSSDISLGAYATLPTASVTGSVS